MIRVLRRCLQLLIVAVLFGRIAFGAESEETFARSIQPLLKEYCLSCHSTEKHKGDLDLQRFKSLTEVKKEPKIWQALIEQLALNEMPPKKSPQLPAADKERLNNWIHGVLEEIAMANAGDPGPVLLRRLSNAEYTYTIRDLTGVESLDPAKEFPVDGAAGEGFTNTGQSLVMSPSLFQKYLDAGKAIAAHAVLLPDGLRFSPSTTRRDQTEEILAQIRKFYNSYTEAGKPIKNTQQGIVMETDGGGRISIEKYLQALIKERSALGSGAKTTDAVARDSGLNAKFMGILYKTLSSTEPSFLLDRIRARWKAAKPEDAAAIANEIGEWQKVLWKFSTVGHIGKLNGPKAWMEPASPLAAKQEVKLKLPPSPDGKDVVFYLSATDAGGSGKDVIEWKEPRLVAPGRPNILLKDVREICLEQSARRERVVSSAAKALAAAAEAGAVTGAVDLPELARKHGVDADVLDAWVRYLGVSGGTPVKVEGHLNPVMMKPGNYDFIQGWGKGEPNIVANSSDKMVRIPGVMKPHSVALHPAPKLQVGAGWQSPVSATVSIDGAVMRAHPECGNGIGWSVELRRGLTRQTLASGQITDNKEKKFGPIKDITVRPGDLISLLIEPRNGDHSCDLTAVELAISTAGEKAEKWSLTDDVSPDITAGNPHADRQGNKDVWHFYSEPVRSTAAVAAAVPAGSVLARWQAAQSADEKSKLATEVQKLLAGAAPEGKDNPDALLYRQITSLGGSFMAGMKSTTKTTQAPNNAQTVYGVDAALFAKTPAGGARDASSLCVLTPSVLEVRLPAELAAGCEFVATGLLDKESLDGAVQLQVLTTKPAGTPGLVAGNTSAQLPRSHWTDPDLQGAYSAPIVVNEGSAARKRIEAGFEEFRQIFPAALCYTKIVPVDEVVTLTLFYRQDEALARLMLNDSERERLDKLWSEMHYVAQDALTLVDAFEQIWQYSTQDGDPKSLEPLREPIKQGAAKLKAWLVETQPKHVDAILQFADSAFRRPLTEKEKEDLRGLYKKLRDQELPHEEAVRLTLARIFVSPAFLYRAEKPGPGSTAEPVSDIELANRLSYFLWSSMPDAELRALAEAGKLRQPEVLAAQTKRMLKDRRTRRLATEFGCAWLHISGFDELSEKSDRHFPTFLGLRGAMYEESIQFFADFFQNDGSVLGLIDSDHTFLNEALAKHYGIPNVKGPDFRRVDGVKKFARGGILGQATTLAKQSGASRTSPILRGNWVSEALLGDKLPKPPKDVPQLPEDEANETLTVRQLTEKHSSDARCASCHQRIDAFGFSLERFDAIGRFRDKDLGNRPIDTNVKTMDGAQFDGLDGLRNYLLTTKRDAFVRQFCKKLLGYSLGRAVQLSDESLLREMQSLLKANDYRIGVIVEKIVQSSQFQKIRGISSSLDD